MRLVLVMFTGMTIMNRTIIGPGMTTGRILLHKTRLELHTLAAKGNG